MLHIAMYVSGHGYGHATRVCLVAAELLSLGHSVTVCSLAPPFIFQDLLNAYPMTCSLRSARLLDRGIIQADPFTIHVQDSFKNLSEFLSSPLLAKDIQDEAKWLLSNSVQIVYLDAPFGPILAAKEAGIPSVIVSNFTFDSIYTGLLTSSDSQTDSNTRDMIASVTSMYSQADACIRLPGYIPIPSFTTKSDNFVSVSLVARKAKRSKNDVRRELGLKLDTLVLLVTLGGFDLAGDDLKAWARSSLPPGWKVIVACPHSIEQDDERMRVVKSEEWYIPDLINAVDVVLGKVGYGTCSEVVAHSKPFIYVSRPLFAEEPGMMANLMKPYGRVVEMSISDFKTGSWTCTIERAMALPPPPLTISLDGHLQVCQHLLGIAACQTS